MSAKTIPNQTRYVTIKRFCEDSGLSYATVDHMLKSGQIPFITTESGQRRIDTNSGNVDSGEIMKRLDKQEKLLLALCKQFNTSGVMLS